MSNGASQPEIATSDADAERDPPALQSLGRLVRSLVRHAPTDVVVVIALTFATILTSSVGLLMLVPLLGVAGLDVGGGSIGQLTALAVDALAAVGLSLTVPAVLGAYLLLVLLGAVLQRSHAIRTAALYQDFIMRLRLELYGAITHARWSSFLRRTSSSFIHALTIELERVGGATAALLNLFVKAVMAAVYVGLAVFLSPLTTLLVVACGAALMALLARKTRLGRAKGEAVSEAYEDLYGAISEHLAGLRISKGHGVEGFHVERFRLRSLETAHVQTDVVRNQADVGFWLQLGSATIMAGVFSSALLVFELPLASILLLLYLFARLVPMLTGLQRQVQGVLNLVPAVDRVEATLRWLDEHGETRGARADAPVLARALELHDVRFGYADGPVLHDVDLVIAAGRTTAIVGPSGGGKSTIADLVVGLLTPDAGRITIDGVPLDGSSIPAWRHRIGYVNQDPFLFHDTIRENLRAMRPDADDATLFAALRAASASFVEALPQGLDTVVGDRGLRLSGGERQRIALARAVVRQPDLLVLDEATSALDPENERVIQQAIDRMRGPTILVIAHRLASVRRADTIYVVESGRVVEAGTWADLVARPEGRFRAMCSAQGLLEGPKSAATPGA